MVELSDRAILICVLLGMGIGLLRDRPRKKKKPPDPTPGQKAAKVMEQYIDVMMAEIKGK